MTDQAADSGIHKYYSLNLYTGLSGARAASSLAHFDERVESWLKVVSCDRWQRYPARRTTAYQGTNTTLQLRVRVRVVSLSLELELDSTPTYSSSTRE